MKPNNSKPDLIISDLTTDVMELLDLAQHVMGVKKNSDGAGFDAKTVKTKVALIILRYLDALHISLGDLVLIKPEMGVFTNREADIVKYLVKGLQDEHIGEMLNVTTETVREHMRHIRRKTDATSRLEVLAMLLK